MGINVGFSSGGRGGFFWGGEGRGGGGGGDSGVPSHLRSDSVPNSNSPDFIQKAAAFLGFDYSCDGAGGGAGAGCCTGTVTSQLSYLDQSRLKIKAEISCRNLYPETILCKQVFRRRGGKDNP